MVNPTPSHWIEEKTRRERIWSQRGWEYLKKCRYSLQKPRPHHAKADVQEQEVVKKNSNLE